jgi:hypothetical protein
MVCGRCELAVKSWKNGITIISIKLGEIELSRELTEAEIGWQGNLKDLGFELKMI